MLLLGNLAEEELNVLSCAITLLLSSRKPSKQAILKTLLQRKLSGFLVPPFQKCCEEKDETLWEQATPAAF